MNINYKIKKLSNGINIIYIPINDNDITCISVFCKVGSINENKITKGGSHYLEHMLFKGTNKRPTSKHISTELDEVGAYFNAYTDKNLTSYVIKTPSHNAENSIKILADMLLNSKIDEDELNNEKQVVIEEINQGKDDPSRKVIEYAYEIIFKNNPLSYSIGSEPENILNLNRQNLYDYYKKYYVSNNITISIVSNKPYKEIIKYIKNSDFNNFKSNFNILHNHVPLPIQDKPRYFVENRNLEQIHLVIGFPTESMYSEDRFTLDLIKIILGGNMSSRFFIALRENNGISYNISMELSFYETCGAIFIQTSFNKDSLFIKNESQYNSDSELENIFRNGKFSPGALPIILENLKKIKKNPVSEDELKKAKGYIKGSLVLGLEDKHAISDYYGRQVIFNHLPIHNFKYLIGKYNQITPEKIMEISKKYFNFNKANYTVIGECDEKYLRRFIQEYLQ